MCWESVFKFKFLLSEITRLTSFDVLVNICIYQLLFWFDVGGSVSLDVVARTQGFKMWFRFRLRLWFRSWYERTLMQKSRFILRWKRDSTNSKTLLIPPIQRGSATFWIHACVLQGFTTIIWHGCVLNCQICPFPEIFTCFWFRKEKRLSLVLSCSKDVTLSSNPLAGQIQAANAVGCSWALWRNSSPYWLYFNCTIIKQIINCSSDNLFSIN